MLIRSPRLLASGCVRSLLQRSLAGAACDLMAFHPSNSAHDRDPVVVRIGPVVGVSSCLALVLGRCIVRLPGMWSGCWCKTSGVILVMVNWLRRRSIANFEMESDLVSLFGCWSGNGDFGGLQLRWRWLSVVWWGWGISRPNRYRLGVCGCDRCGWVLYGGVAEYPAPPVPGSGFLRVYRDCGHSGMLVLPTQGPIFVCSFSSFVQVAV